MTEKKTAERTIDTILFDFDGTLMNTNEVIINSWQHTFRTVEGRERSVEEIISTFGEPLKVTMARVLPQIPVEEGVEIYRGYHYGNFGDLISLFPGMRELLDALKGQNYTLGLVTSRLAGTTRQGLEKYGLEPFFDTVVTFEDCDRHKPDPAPVNIALARLKKQPQQAMMIGDSIFDILCAKNAGVTSVLVGWAMAVNEADKTGVNAPDYIIETAKELLSVLEKKNGGISHV